MISEMHKSRVQQYAIKLLSKRLHESLYPHLSLVHQLYTQSPEISSVIKVIIINRVNKEPVRIKTFSSGDKNLQKQCQWEAKRITDKLHPALFNKAVKLLRNDIKIRHRELALVKYDFDHTSHYLEELKDLIQSGLIKKSPLWINGAGVEIVVNQKLSKNYQVVTNNLLIAERLSWVFYQLRDRMIAYVDFSNKRYFYHWLASSANGVLEKDQYEEHDVYNAVINAACDFKEEMEIIIKQFLRDRLDNINSTRKFILENQ